MSKSTVTFLTLSLACAAWTESAILPSDRMAMADRLFDRGAYNEAKAEYTALIGAEGVAPDELLYRLAESLRALGDTAAARSRYAELVEKHPTSRHAARARLSKALAAPTDAEKLSELKSLDNDLVPAETRAIALYHYGTLANDANALSRCATINPKGQHAVYARLRSAQILASDKDPTVRRKAYADLLRLHYLPKSPVADDALYLAANLSYADKRYGESATILRRYERLYPNDKRAKEIRTMHAWSEYLNGKYSESAAVCGSGGTDDTDYLLAACAYASGDFAKAKTLFEKYLASHIDGRYRKAAELPLARMAFEQAGKSENNAENAAMTIEAAKRSAALSNDPADRLRLGWAYEKAGRDDDAASEYGAIARDFPSTDASAEALFRKALVDIRASRWSAAELALAETVSSGHAASRKAEALYWRGVCAFKLEHEAEGSAFLEEAISLGLSMDQSREARLMLADRMFREERTDEARKAYAELVSEGAADRMPASKLRAVGKFLLVSGDAFAKEAEMCGKAIVAGATTPEWRQSGHALEGAAREAAGRFTEALESYRAAMSETCRTEDACEAALSLGILEAKAGNVKEADAALREAVKLNQADNRRRATAYLWLARNYAAAGDMKNAEGCATTVVMLFDDKELVAEAQKIIDSINEGGTGK
ncbi:MAG: tetratricopeptide repeat protein [Lentisphaerae bacterium]|nr:tetratricopeptide repeat protein [Lentisphaerota bacterium]